VVSEKIGDGASAGAVFKSRVPTGELGDEANPEDLVQTRILWLHGLDAENANTHDRYIYIHGTNHEEAIGTAASHGCVRMRNEDVIELFDRVSEGAPVFIEA
jgi:lipoprotein-anchoring transpeptidase ErfK/SrfK